MTLNYFCEKHCDGLYDSKFSYDEQCTGYKVLLYMLKEDIEPVTLEEIKRWENEPTISELFGQTGPEYLRLFHPLLRPFLIENWSKIKKLKNDNI